MKEYEGKYTILNGGTDVMIRLRERLINPEAVIDIKRIPGLKEITFSKKDGLYIGACVTCKEISESEIVKENYPFYAQAASVLGSQLVRGRATSVGNVINASPLADTVTPLAVSYTHLAPPESFMPTTGAPTLRAFSRILQILLA